MASKMECPHCGEEILATATKCKSCFADLNPEDTSKNRSTIIGLLVFLVIIVVVGIGGLQYVYGKSTLSSVTIDEGTDSIIMIWSQFNKEPTTRRVDFADIAKVEFVTGSTVLGGTFWSVFIILNDDEKIRINHSAEDNLKGYAETVSAKTGAPFVPINKVRSGRGLLGPGS